MTGRRPPVPPAAISPVAAEAADLALWTGRIAHADPGWNLDQGPSSAHRLPRHLAPVPGDLATVVAAVHGARRMEATVRELQEHQLRGRSRGAVYASTW